VTSEVVAGHIRGLLAPQPYDIASSDRHTVKPWFTSRLPASPQVPDLGAQGFSLLGGRVDVIGHDPVATIVYKHAAHTISLTTLRSGQSIPDQTVSGYNVRSWSDPYFTYVAVSDLAGADLAAFERAFSKASPAPEIKEGDPGSATFVMRGLRPARPSTTRLREDDGCPDSGHDGNCPRSVPQSGYMLTASQGSKAGTDDKV